MSDDDTIGVQLGYPEGRRRELVLDLPSDFSPWERVEVVDLTAPDPEPVQPIELTEDELWAEEREGLKQMKRHFTTNGGRVTHTEEGIQLSHPMDYERAKKATEDYARHGYNPADHDVAPPKPTFSPVWETTDQAARRETFLAEYERQNPYTRARGGDVTSGHGSPGRFEMTGKTRAAGVTWSDGSPVLGTDGRPVFPGTMPDPEQTLIYQDDASQIERNAIVAKYRRDHNLD